MTSNATSFKLTITVTDPQTMQEKIDEAVQKTIGHALHLRQGILVIQETHATYTITTSPQVPCGTTNESRSEEAAGVLNNIGSRLDRRATDGGTDH